MIDNLQDLVEGSLVPNAIALATGCVGGAFYFILDKTIEAKIGKTIEDYGIFGGAALTAVQYGLGTFGVEGSLYHATGFLGTYNLLDGASTLIKKLMK